MRITLLTNRDIASNIALNRLASGLADHQLRVLLSEQVGGNAPRPHLADLAFAEQQLFNQILFPALEQQTPPASSMLTFNQFSLRGIPVKALANINSEEGLKQLAAGKPHLILSVRFGQILQQRAIDIPEFGVINLHSGLLPEYRGVMATFWAMLNRETDIGTTLHQIEDAGVDTGGVIKISSQPVNYNQSYFVNMLNLYEQGIDDMIEAVNLIGAGAHLRTREQHASAAKYYKYPTADDVQQFEQQGSRLVNYDDVINVSKRFLSKI